MTDDKKVINLSVVQDEHVKKIEQKGFTVGLDSKKDAKKEVVVDKGK